jgi:Copper type II ascorbate-dependent monooxygenase, N-terminal domain/Copper type II ascorbate-dependent monooxygenase, C-terminal domain
MPSAVRTRQMPPWGTDNSGACNTYQDARWLTDDEIATIAAWAEGDRRKGDPAAAPGLPEPLPGLPRVDATAAMPEPYMADGSLGDDYRCFIVDPGIAQDAFMTGFEVRPGEPSVVHHMLLFQLQTAEAETAAAQLDAQSPGPGYTCFGGVGSAASSLIGVWAPGVRASRYPEGTGLPIKGGRKMVVQIHYHNHGAPLLDKTAVDLMIEPTVAEPSFLYLLAAPNLYLPPGKPEVVTTNQFQLPGFLGQYNVWGVFPHMHTRGTSLRVEVDHAGQNQCITDVPRWDFNWQQGYFYDGPPRIAGGGDTVRITCTHNTMMEGKPITWGEGTDDEMCLAFLYVSPY